MTNQEISPTPPESDEIAVQLRELRYADPSPELRCKTLGAARQALKEASSSSAIGDWWREIALAAAVAAIFAISWPSFSATKALPQRQSPRSIADGESLATTLGLEGDFANYIGRRFFLHREPGPEPAPGLDRYDDPT